MADEAPAVAPEPETPAAPAPDPAAQAASEAAKTLAQRRAEVRGKLEKPAAPPVDAKTEAPKPPEQPKKPTEPDTDEVLALIKRDREVKAAAKKLEEERAALKAYEADVQRAKAAREARDKGDKLGVLKALFPDEDLTEDLFWDLAKIVGAQGDGEGVSVEKVTAAALAELDKRQRAEQDAAAAKQREAQQALASRFEAVDEQVGDGFSRAVVHLAGIANDPDEAKAQLVEAYGEYARAAAQTFDLHKDRLPAIAQFGVSPSEVVRVAEEKRLELKRQPTPLEVLQAIEEQFVARIRGTPYAAPAQQPPRPAPTVTSAWRGDVGRPATPEGKPETLEQIRERRRQLLMQQRPAS